MSIYIYLLIIFALFSISVYEALILLGILYSIFYYLKNRQSPSKGSLGIPVFIFFLTSALSTLIYFPKMFLKGFYEGFFQLIYFFPVRKENYEELAEKVLKLLFFMGLISLFVYLYNFILYNKHKIFWGGIFEVGNFFSIFFFASLILCFKEFTKRSFMKASLYFISALIFISVVFVTARRSYILAIMIVGFLLLYILTRNRVLPAKAFFITTGILIGLISSGYLYLIDRDVRFKTLHEIIIGKRSLDKESINVISSARYNIMLDGIEIIKNDIKNLNIGNLLIGHGVRSGLYLPHRYSPSNWERYESVILVSEFIERGIIGLTAILAIYFLAFKRFLTLKVNKENITLIVFFIPLLLHLIASIFTFFWDALLPLYFLLFRLGEVAYERQSINVYTDSA